MPDLTSIASGASGGSVTTMAKAQNAQKAMAAQLIKGLEQSSQAIRSAGPNRIDSVQISPQAQALFAVEQR